MKRKQESVFVEEQAARQERDENVEVHRSRVEETQPLPTGEMREMVEMWKEIRRLREQVGSRAPVPKRSSPFSLAILEEGLPPNFRQSNIGEYDGHTDPEEHLGRFEKAALLHQYSDGVKCRVFLGTLGLRGGEFFKSLVKKHPSSYDDLLARAEKYVNLEDAQRHKRMEQRPGRSRVEGAERGSRKRGAAEREDDKARSGGQLSSHVPLDGSLDKVMEVRESEGRWEKSQRVECSTIVPSGDKREGSLSRSRQRSRSSPRRGQGPPWINQRIGEQRGDGRCQDVPQEPVEPRRGMNEDNHPTRGRIHMISGGATDGDSGRARKARGRRLENFEISRGSDLPQDPALSFGPEDLRGVVTPHNDALVVTATIANYDVARIFIDNGSSVNVLFKSTLDQMKVEGFEFEPVCTPLYGFAEHVILPLGKMFIPLSLGHEPLRITKMMTFTVVGTPSAYNGIPGRPALKDFRAVASICHQKLKFPVGKGVGVLCGDHKVARRCYQRIVKEEEKRGREHSHGSFSSVLQL
ncbi:uncharacterized protein [Primulina huaijiensis]|uniref:uncharacterized protein n=1 Tax=Primulina huaijiensis TaxID=1492673 RepID=UPI003CC6F91F